MQQRIPSIPRDVILPVLVLLAAVASASTAAAAGAADSSVEPYRDAPGPGFYVWVLACDAGRDACVSDRHLTEPFLLQYVELSLLADPGAVCQGDARILVDRDQGTRTISLLDLAAADTANEANTVVLPSPVRMQVGEQLEVYVRDDTDGGACHVNARFGGIRGTRINPGTIVPLPPTGG